MKKNSFSENNSNLNTSIRSISSIETNLFLFQNYNFSFTIFYLKKIWSHLKTYLFFWLFGSFQSPHKLTLLLNLLIQWIFTHFDCVKILLIVDKNKLCVFALNFISSLNATHTPFAAII